MPKGVEHPPIPELKGGEIGVSFPVMPKGVEHLYAGQRRAGSGGVSFPVMPKGVEHLKRQVVIDYPSA